MTKIDRMRLALNNLDTIKAERCRRSFYYFMRTFWSEVSNDEFYTNWHIELFSEELEKIAFNVANNKRKEYDLIVNVPPGTTKTITFSIMFPIWCWINWYWLRFITGSYSAALSLESAMYSRDIIRSAKFRRLFPEITIKQDKDTKSNFRVQKFQRIDNSSVMLLGGNRYSTSIGGTLTGFHGHINIVDDPLNPEQAVSETELNKANRWISQTLSTRKANKATTVMIVVMQRLHQNDPTGFLLAKKKDNVKHISLPGEIRNYKKEVRPQELASKYINDLLDPKRMDWQILNDMEADLGQYGYAGQVGQRPTPPGGGMFKVDHFQIIDKMVADVNIVSRLRFWDKAGTEGGTGARTAGTAMCRLSNGKFLIIDCKKGRWAAEEREKIIRETAEADGKDTIIWVEQEPGSGGKESAQGTIRNLAGFSVYAQTVSGEGDKVRRADPYSVQVNNGNVLLLRGDWNHDFIEEHRNAPFSTTKDQWDSASGAFAKSVGKKIASML